MSVVLFINASLSLIAPPSLMILPAHNYHFILLPFLLVHNKAPSRSSSIKEVFFINAKPILVIPSSPITLSDHYHSFVSQRRPLQSFNHSLIRSSLVNTVLTIKDSPIFAAPSSPMLLAVLRLNYIARLFSSLTSLTTDKTQLSQCRIIHQCFTYLCRSFNSDTTICSPYL